MLKLLGTIHDSIEWEASPLGALYLNKVLRELKRPLTLAECDIVSKFFEAGYSVNYTVEYLK